MVAGVDRTLMSRTRIYEGKIVTLEVLDGRWEVARHASAVAVLVVRDGLVLGVRQRRPAIDADTWELPAGLIDPGESPAEAAARELREETQLCGRLEPLSRAYVSPGFTDEEVHLFEAHDLEACDGTPDETESLIVEWQDPKDAWRDIAAGRLASSAITALGLRHAMARLGVSL